MGSDCRRPRVGLGAAPLVFRDGETLRSSIPWSHTALRPCRLAVLFLCLFPLPRVRVACHTAGGTLLQQNARTYQDRVACRARRRAPRPRRMHLPPRELRAPARASLSRRTDEFHGWTVTTERTMDGRCRRRLVNARCRRQRGQGGVEIFSNHKTTRTVLFCGGMGKGHTYGMVHRGGCRAQTTWFAAAPGVCRAERNQPSSLASASSAPCAPPMGGIVVAVVITHRWCPGRRRCSVAAGPPSVRCSLQLHDHWPCDVN